MRNGQRGQTLVIFALAAVALIGLASIALDQGLAMSDRRNLQTAADGASLAGTRQYSLVGDANYVHYVATQYLVGSLGGTVPPGCTKSVCGDGPWTVGSFTFTFVDNAPTTLDVRVQHSRPTLLAGVLGINSETVGTGARSRPVGPLMIKSVYNVAALAANFGIDGGGTCDPSGNVSGNVYSNGPFGSNNGGHCHPIQVPTVQAGYDGNGNYVACPGNVATEVAFGPSGSSAHWLFTPGGTDPGTPTHTNVPPPYAFDNDPPRLPSIVYTSATPFGTDHDINGNWMPGTYDGFIPSGPAKLTGGVYLLVNVANPDISGVVQFNAHGGHGKAAGSDAVAIVLDHTDTGQLTIGSVQLNGFEGSGPSADTVGTHNFVLYGGPSNANSPTHGGFQGAISSLGPGNSPDISGILYMPNSGLSSNGNPSYTFNGSVYMSSYELGGGGNGGQGFRFICDLNSIAGKATEGGLTR